MNNNNLYSNNYFLYNNNISLKEYFFSYNYFYHGYPPDRKYEYKPLPCCTLYPYSRYRGFPYWFSIKVDPEPFPYSFFYSYLFYSYYIHEIKKVMSTKQKIINQGLAISFPICSMAAMGMTLNKKEIIFSHDEEYWEQVKL